MTKRKLSKKKPGKPSEILPTLLECHQKLLLYMMRRRGPFGFEGQLEMTDDPVDNLMIIYERDDLHSASTCGTKQGIYLIHLADHLCPALGRHISRTIFGYERIKRISLSLMHLPPVGIGVKAVVADHDLTLIRNMRSDSGDEHGQSTEAYFSARGSQGVPNNRNESV
jgi:hypothetical protein